MIFYYYYFFASFNLFLEEEMKLLKISQKPKEEHEKEPKPQRETMRRYMKKWKAGEI